MTTLTLSTGRKVSTESIEMAAELALQRFSEVYSFTKGFDIGFLDLYAEVVPMSEPDDDGQCEYAGWRLTFCTLGLGDYALSYYDIRVNTINDGWIEEEPTDAAVYEKCVAHLNRVKRFFFETIGLTEEDFNATVL